MFYLLGNIFISKIFLFSFKITVLLLMFAKQERGGMRSEMDERG